MKLISHRRRRPGLNVQALVQNPISAFMLIFFITLALAVFVLFMQREWRQGGQRTVVIVHDSIDEIRKPLTIAVLDPNEPSLTLMPLTPEKPISPLLNFGTYPTQALVGLTQQEKLRWEFLRGSLALEYGVAVDGIIWTNKTEVKTRGDLRAIVLSAVANQNSTTLAYWDRWQLLSMIEMIPDYKLDITYPAEADSTAYEQWGSRVIQDNALRSSAVAVAIQNASGVQGLATRFSRMLRLMGYDVRNIETVETQVKSRLIYRPDLDDTVSGKWSVDRLHTAAGYLELEPESSTPQKLRSDIVVVLGTDWEDRLSLHPQNRR